MRFVNGEWDLAPPPRTEDQGTIETVEFSGRIFSEESKECFIGRKGHGDQFLGFPRCNHHRLSAEGTDNHGAEIYWPYLMQYWRRNGPVCTEKKCFSTTTMHLSRIVVTKLHDLRYRLVSDLSYSPDLVTSDFILFPTLKKSLTGKRFTSNEEAIAVADGYFADLNISCFSDGLKILELRLYIVYWPLRGLHRKIKIKDGKYSYVVSIAVPN